MNEADQPVATSYCLQSSNQMNEKEGRMRDIDPPLPTAQVPLDLTHLKTYCCIVQPGKSAAELHWHCLVKFIWNNGDLELLSHICVPAREGTIGFYMEHWFIPQLLSTTCEVTEHWGFQVQGNFSSLSVTILRWTETVKLSTFIIHSCHSL